MTDRELLEQVFNFLVRRNFIQGDEASVRDMVTRYKQPPLTMYHLVCMQMTMEDYRKLEKLLEQMLARFDPNVIAAEEIANEPA